MLLTLGCPSSNRAASSAVLEWRSIRSSSVLSPRRIRKQLNGDRVAPVIQRRPVWRQAVMISVVPTTSPAMISACPPIHDEKEEVDEATEFVDDKDRITKPRITKYERVRLICDRAKQIALGAKPMIDITSTNNSKLTPKEVAELELKHNTMPLMIIRPLSNGKRERWKISELEH